LTPYPQTPRNRRAIIIGGSIATHLGIAKGAHAAIGDLRISRVRRKSAV